MSLVPLIESKSGECVHTGIKEVVVLRDTAEERKKERFPKTKRFGLCSKFHDIRKSHEQVGKDV